ncbi:MAG TPA: response regulator, partial [Candidatus Synoicihabitans sp.]|nr:response regulator [Candidatus Synoicihabitans sp.]
MTANADLHEAGLAGLRILLVEDEAMVAMLIEGMLEDLGCRVAEWATNVGAALEAVDRDEFDGALLDVNLRGEPVYPVAELLAGRRLPFIFVTGYGRTADPLGRFSDAAVLKKPFD